MDERAFDTLADRTLQHLFAEIDAENRGAVIDDYRKTPDGWAPETDY